MYVLSCKQRAAVFSYSYYLNTTERCGKTSRCRSSWQYVVRNNEAADEGQRGVVYANKAGVQAPEDEKQMKLLKHKREKYDTQMLSTGSPSTSKSRKCYRSYNDFFEVSTNKGSDG